MGAKPPFPRPLQLNNEPCPPPNDVCPSDTIPGQPALALDPGKVLSFLHNELDTPVINELQPYLPFVARKSADHIDPLHHQIIKGRQILVTEDPSLHLVWWNNVIFIKPIPACLLNWDFWDRWMCHAKWILRHNDKNDRHIDKDQATNWDWDNNNEATDQYYNWSPVGAAIGFLRTYAHLIHHPSDFRIAQDTALVPIGPDITFRSFSLFIDKFRSLQDGLVSPRYEYGQLRLTRLNMAVHLVRPRAAKGAWNYHEMYWQTGQYLSSFAAPLMFVFGSVAVMLSAMQVVVSIPDPGLVMNETGWKAFRHVSWGTSVIVLVMVLLIWCALLGGICCLLLAQFAFSVRQLRPRTVAGYSSQSNSDRV